MLQRGGLFFNWTFTIFASVLRSIPWFRVDFATQRIHKCFREVDCLLIECSYFLHRFGIGFGIKTTQKCSHGGVPETPGRGQGCPRARGLEKTQKTQPFGTPTGAPFRPLWVLMGVFRATFWRPNRVLDVIFSQWFSTSIFISFLMDLSWICEGILIRCFMYFINCYPSIDFRELWVLRR